MYNINNLFTFSSVMVKNFLIYNFIFTISKKLNPTCYLYKP